MTFWQSAEQEQGRIFLWDLVNEKKNQSAWFVKRIVSIDLTGREGRAEPPPGSIRSLPLPVRFPNQLALQVRRGPFLVSSHYLS